MSEPLKTFSIRIPEELERQIQERAAASRRSRNKQIEFMLTQMIDRQVAADLAVMRT